MTGYPRIATFLLVFSAFFSFAAAGFELRNNLLKLQNEFGRSRPYPIVIFDKDELQWRFARAGALEKGLEDRRNQIIADYVAEVTGVTLTAGEASHFEPYLTVLKEGAFALPVLASRFPVSYKVCGVFPASEASNQSLEHHRILQLEHPAHSHGYQHLHSRLSFEELARFSLYHELAHCLDQVHLPQSFEYEDPHTIHLAESFAEAWAALRLKSEGVDVTLPRAQLRSVYSSVMGPFFARNPQGGFGHPYYAAGGAIYNLAPVLLASQDHPGASDATEDAQLLVREHATSGRAMSAITRWMAEGDEAIQVYARWAQDMPELFQEAHLSLLRYTQQIPDLALAAFGPELPRPELDAEYSAWPLKALCQAFRKNQRESFENLRRGLITELRQKERPFVEMKARQQKLWDLSLEMTSSCAAP